MNRIEIFQVLGIEETKDERALKAAYRQRLSAVNPEDDPEGFKRLRTAYEEACRLARQQEEEDGEQPGRDETPSGVWVEKAAEIYGSIRRRQNVEEWKKLFDDDCFLSLEEEENCREKLLRFLMEHFRLPGNVWKLLDKMLSLTADAARLREKFPADFIRYILGKCEQGEDVEFDQFEGEDDAPYDLFLQYYDRCWQALQQDDLKQAKEALGNADDLNIRHPAMEICRAELLSKQEKPEEAVALLEKLMEKCAGETASGSNTAAMVRYNTAESLWQMGKEKNGEYRRRSVEIYQELKAENDTHYMANVRLTEWYYDRGEFREAKKCAEKVLTSGGSDEFMELLGKVNREIEKELEEKWRIGKDSEAALELCWCYLQDGKVFRGIQLAVKLDRLLPPEKEAEWNGLMAKLHVEAAEYETAITMTRFWEKELEKKLLGDESEGEKERDRDRLRQAHMIRMQCHHNIGYRDSDRFPEAIREGEAVLEDSTKDIGILLEMAQIYTEMEEYEKCEEIVSELVEEYQIYAAFATSMEAYRRQLNAGGVIRTGEQCVRCFPTFAKAYEYMAKVYLDLERWEDLARVFEDAEKNGVKSAILEAYRFQKDHKTMEIEVLNNKLKRFRKEIRKPLEEGKPRFYETGLPVLTEYLYHCPDSYMFVERGIFHRAGHHYEEAREDFEKAISLNPSNPYAYNGLSFVYKYMGNYEKALYYIKKAILYMDDEMSPVIYTDMADLYSLLGCYDKALEACRQYEAITQDTSIWFLKQYAECCVNLGRAKEACELHEKYAEKDKFGSLENCVDACLKCGEPELAGQKLAVWAEALGIRKGLRAGLGFGRKDAGPGSKEYIRYYKYALWAALICGTVQDAADCINHLKKYALPEEKSESRLADMVMACILCGMEKEGRKYGAQLAKALRRESFAERDLFYDREKAHLQLKILAAWYTEPEEKLEELFGKEESTGVCHYCTSVVCREMEGVRILYLLRQGKEEEAWERLHRNLELQPADEYMLAIKHIRGSAANK